MKKSTRILIGSGGTGGHIFPGIAIAQELRKQGVKILWIGERSGMEVELVGMEGIDFIGINISKLHRKFSLKNLVVPIQLLKSIVKLQVILWKFKPHAVLCTGSFVGAPVALAAILNRIPLFFQECNSYPGLTTRLLAHRTQSTYVAYDSTSKYLKGVNALNFGIPLPEKRVNQEAITLTELGLIEGNPVLLVTGGSQGSLAINETIHQAIPELLKRNMNIIWQTGKLTFARFAQNHAGTPGLYIFDFSPFLGSFYSIANLAVTRAGAMTIAELEANRLPAVLIPLPTAAENHQYHNAVEQEKKGFALILEQKDLTVSSLCGKLDVLQARMQQFKERLQTPRMNAAKLISQDMLNYLKRN